MPGRTSPLPGDLGAVSADTVRPISAFGEYLGCTAVVTRNASGARHYPQGMLRSVILAASRNHGIERLVSNAPVSRTLCADLSVAPTHPPRSGQRARWWRTACTSRSTTSAKDTADAEQASAIADEYLGLLQALDRAGLAERLAPLTARAEVSVKLSAIGQALPGDGEKIALENARRICAAARGVGATVTLDMEDHATTDSTLSTLVRAAGGLPGNGRRAAVLPAAHRGRLPRPVRCRKPDPPVQGAYKERRPWPTRTTTTSTCPMYGAATSCSAGLDNPMFATHDPRLVAIVRERAKFHGQGQHQYEVCRCCNGVRRPSKGAWPGRAETVRVYVPYGSDWYGYLDCVAWPSVFPTCCPSSCVPW